MIRSSFISAVLSLMTALQVLPAIGLGGPQSGPQAGPGGHRVEINLGSGARTWPESNRWTADVVAPDGTRLYRVERVVPFDFPYPTLTVASNGYGVLLDAAQGRVEFLSPRGDVAAAWAPFASPIPSYERIIKCSIGDRTAAFQVSEPGVSEVRVVVTDLTGRVLRATSMPGTCAGEILVGGDDAVVLASATVDGERIRHVTRLLGPEGETQLEVPILFRVGYVDPASGRYAFADRHTVFGGHTGRRGTAYRLDACAGERIITALRCGPNGALVVTESVGMDRGSPSYRNAEVLTLDAGGAVLGRTRLVGESTLPAAVSEEGTEAVVRAGTKTARFRGVL
jgi:hypothetical protein